MKKTSTPQFVRLEVKLDELIKAADDLHTRLCSTRLAIRDDAIEGPRELRDEIRSALNEMEKAADMIIFYEM